MGTTEKPAGSKAKLLLERASARPHAILLVALAGFIAGTICAPELSKGCVRESYEPFLNAAAGLIVGLFVVVALEARYLTTSAPLAISTISVIALAVAGSVLTLLPDLPTFLYQYLFGALVGGALASLLAVGQISIAALIASRDESRKQRHRQHGGPP